jgi:hypothetical protein
MVLLRFSNIEKMQRKQKTGKKQKAAYGKKGKTHATKAND